MFICLFEFLAIITPKTNDEPHRVISDKKSDKNGKKKTKLVFFV